MHCSNRGRYVMNKLGTERSRWMNKGENICALPVERMLGMSSDRSDSWKKKQNEILDP